LIFQGKSVFFKELNYSYVKRLSGIYRFTDTEMAVNSNTIVTSERYKAENILCNPFIICYNQKQYRIRPDGNRQLEEKTEGKWLADPVVPLDGCGTNCRKRRYNRRMRNVFFG